MYYDCWSPVTGELKNQSRNNWQEALVSLKKDEAKQAIGIANEMLALTLEGGSSSSQRKARRRAKEYLRWKQIKDEFECTYLDTLESL